MPIRKIIFWSHLVVGVATGLVIFMLAVTGVLLTYEAQIIRLAESRYDVPVSSAAPLSADALAEHAMAATNGQATSLVYKNAPGGAVLASAGRSGKTFLDPYTGEVLATGATGTQQFFSKVTSLHRWLSFDGRNSTGAAITGASNLLFLFLLVTGAYLWLPRIWKWGMLKTKMKLRRSYPNSKARDFSWHHVFAFWAAIPLVVIVVSGAIFSYSWTGNLLFAAYGEEAPARKNRTRGAAGTPQPLNIGEAGLQQALTTAAAQTPNWNRMTLTLPKGAQAETVSVMVDTGMGHQQSRQETLMLDQSTGEIVAPAAVAERSPAMKARMWMRFAHTGEYYGIVGQTIAGLASLAAAILAYTGLALSYRRLIQPRLRRATSLH